jgi:ribosomal protein L7Ae-like RNA K-turn-binding protein
MEHTGRTPGRGVYICWNAICLHKALKPAKLTVALKHPVVVPPFEVMAQAIDKCLSERLRACLSLAYKARAAVSGYQALRSAWAQANILYMVFAEDIAAERAKEYSIWCAQSHIPYITFGTKEELGQLLGKPSRSAIGLTAPHFRDLLVTKLAILEQWRASQGDHKLHTTFSPR